MLTRVWGQVREGVVATENLTLSVRVDSHPNVTDVRFKVPPHTRTHAHTHTHTRTRILGV